MSGACIGGDCVRDDTPWSRVPCTERGKTTPPPSSCRPLVRIRVELVGSGRVECATTPEDGSAVCFRVAQGGEQRCVNSGRAFSGGSSLCRDGDQTLRDIGCDSSRGLVSDPCTASAIALSRGYRGIECTSQRVDKNRRCQRVCLNRRRVCRFVGSVGFYPRAARYILFPPVPRTGLYMSYMGHVVQGLPASLINQNCKVLLKNLR